MWRCLQIHLTRCGQEIVMHKYSTEIIEACVYTSVYLDMYKKTILILLSINCLCYKSPKSKASIAIDQKLGLRFRKIVVWQNSREPAGNLLAICHIPPQKNMRPRPRTRNRLLLIFVGTNLTPTNPPPNTSHHPWHKMVETQSRCQGRSQRCR